MIEYNLEIDEDRDEEEYNIREFIEGMNNGSWVFMGLNRYPNWGPTGNMLSIIDDLHPSFRYEQEKERRNTIRVTALLIELGFRVCKELLLADMLLPILAGKAQ